MNKVSVEKKLIKTDTFACWWYKAMTNKEKETEKEKNERVVSNRTHTFDVHDNEECYVESSPFIWTIVTFSRVNVA